MTGARSLSADVVPALALLAHAVRLIPLDANALLPEHDYDVILVDARTDLATARTQCRLAAMLAPSSPIVAVVTEGGLAAISSDWGIDDVMLTSAGPAEIEARLRLVSSRRPVSPVESNELITSGELVVDEEAYTARIAGRALDLTYKEFELLKFLAQHPGRAFTRAQLLQEVWGYDYFGGTRTVDVHVRRLRAKLGRDYETMVGTVRNVGYRLVPSAGGEEPPGDAAPARPDRG